MKKLLDSFRFGLEAKRQIRAEVYSDLRFAWMAERVRLDDGTMVMRTFKVEIRDSDYMYHLVANNTPEYHRAMEILSHYGVNTGMVMKGRELVCSNRNTAMAACWQDADRPVLSPTQDVGDSTSQILKQLRNYDVIEEIKNHVKRSGVVGEVQKKWGWV
jgi:hypothetical protein